jgi:hypothetical protein
MKLFFIQTTPSSTSMPRKRSDSIYIAISNNHFAAFQAAYEKELLRYTEWNATLGYNCKGVNNEAADSAYCRVLQVQAYGVSENVLTQIEKLQEQAIIGRLECARGNARKLKNIPIPYPFEMVAFPFYKQYMEELGEKVEFQSSLPKFFKKD